MLNKNFARGLLEGFAKTSAKGINDAMDDLDGRISRLTEKRINKISTAKPIYDKDFRENEEQIKYYAGLLNTNGGTRGMELLHSLINKETWEGAKVIVPEIHKKLVNTGLIAGKNYMPLSYTDEKGDRKIPTSKQLANLVTMPLSLPSGKVDEESLKGSGFSLLNFITRGNNSVEKYVSKRMSADLAMAGYSDKNLQTNYGELPTSGTVTVDRFDLQLGKSHENDLKLINAKIATLQDSNGDINEIDRLKKLGTKAQSIISNLGEKELTKTDINRTYAGMVELTADAFNVEMTLLPSGNWQTVGGIKANGEMAKALGNSLTSNVAWAHKGGRSDVNSKNLGLTARGFLDEKFKNKLNNGDILKFSSPNVTETLYEPTSFSFIAAQNGYKTIRVTKDMIIGIGKDGTFADVNNGQPYLTLGEKIKANTQVIKKAKKTITNDTSTDNDDEQTISDNFNAKWLKLRKDKASPNKFAVAARQIKNYLLNRGITYTEAELKNEFSLITNGSEWKPSYGSITESQ